MPEKSDNSNYLAEACERVDILSYLSFHDYLAAIYRHLKLTLPSYSYVQFSIDLGFSASNQMRLVISGKRKLTLKAAERLVQGLGLKSFSKKYFLYLVSYFNARSGIEREKIMEKIVEVSKKHRSKDLEQEYLEYLSHWYTPVIRELVAADDFDGTAEWVQHKLIFPLRLDEVKQSFQLLERLGMLVHNQESQTYQSTSQHVLPPKRKDSVAIARFHTQMLDLSKEAISRVPEPNRTLKSLTVRLSERKFLALRARINKLLEDAVASETASGGSVCQLNIQLFPFFDRDSS